MTDHEIMLDAFDRIALPSGWCVGYQAVTGAGRHVPPDSPHARRFDIAGAIMAAGGRENGPRLVAIADRAARDRGYANMAVLNDTSSHSAVLRFMEEVIKNVQPR